MRSLRRTLTVRFAITIFLALSLIASWAYVGVRRTLETQLDRSLSSALKLEAALIAAGMPVPAQPAESINDFITEVNRFVVVRDSNGSEVGTNTPWAGNLPLDLGSFIAARTGIPTWTTQDWQGRHIRSLFAPAPSGSSPQAVVIQVAASLEPLATTSRAVLLLMIGTVVLGSTATTLGAGWLAGSAIKPVKQITREAESITPNSLERRITTHADVEEFEGLVQVLNSMLERIERALRTQQRIIADLGHELRTPLTAMRGTLEVGLRSQRSPDQYQRILQSTLEEVDHLSSVAEMVVLLTKIEFGELHPRLEPTDVVALVQEHVAQAKSKAGNRSIVLNKNTVARQLVNVDKKLIELVIDQLLDNAIEHTPDNTEVHVAIDAETDGLSIAVDDNGSGVPEAEIQQLFEPLYRADKARSRRAGVGLGLPIAAAVLRAHGGSITAGPSELGGLNVTLHFPSQPAS